MNPRCADCYTKEEAYQYFNSLADPHGKFGIPTEELRGLVEKSRLTIHGVHAHVGTQMDHVGAFATIARELHHALDTLPQSALPQTGQPLIVNLGGGLGIPFRDGQELLPIDALAGPIEAERRPGCQYWMEPGHTLVGTAAGLLARVVGKKRVRGRTWAIADVGTDQLAVATLLRWPHQVLGPDGAPLPAHGPDALGGPLCFLGDTLVPETDASGLEVGDPVLVQHAGAYCFALSSPFNGRDYGGTAMLRADGGGIVTADAPRHPNDTPALLSHRWAAEEAPFAAPRPVPPERVPALGGARAGGRPRPADSDGRGFKFERVEHVAPRVWRFVARAGLGADAGPVSLPALLRVASDAAAAALALASPGRGGAAGAAWCAHAACAMPRPLPAAAPLVLRVSLSRAVRVGPDSDGSAGRAQQRGWRDGPRAVRGRGRRRVRLAPVRAPGPRPGRPGSG
jgi:diaminopimelate decarboxylase